MDQIEPIYHLSLNKLVYMRTTDSYHLNIGIVIADHVLMIQSRMEVHQSIKMANLCLK
jgi:hypothetical protein